MLQAGQRRQLLELAMQMVPALFCLSVASSTEAKPHAQSLVLLRHRPEGVAWLQQRWRAVTSPASRSYRQFATRGEVLGALVDSEDARAVEAWLLANGQRIERRFGDAFAVRGLPLRAPLHRAIAAVEPSTVSAKTKTRTRRWRRAPAANLKSQPPGSAAPTLRSLYSVPARAHSSGASVSAWQGAGCRVYTRDVKSYCTESGLPAAGGCKVLSVPPAAPNASAACIEADLDAELLLAAADDVLSISGPNVFSNGTGLSFVAWATVWFAESNASDILTVSWGGAEGPTRPNNWTQSSQYRLSVEFMKLGAIGRAVFWAAGDSGACAACFC